MQPPSKSKTWANEDSAGIEAKTTLVSAKASSDDRESLSDKEYQHVTKKRKRSLDDSEKTNKGATPEYDQEASKGVLAPRESSSNDAATLKDLPVVTSQQPNEESTVASDADWLRSRTSRLLGLLDDDDAMTAEHPQPAEMDYDKTQRALSKVPVTTRTSDVGSETGEKADEHNIETIKIAENLKQGIIDTGRLFVRNLSYSTTEDDLRARFDSFGDLEEVSQYDKFSLIERKNIFAFHSRPMMNFQIGTPYALHLMKTGRVF